MSSIVTITYNGADYFYPIGPTLPNFFVLPQADGRIIFHLGVLGPLPKDQDPKQPFVMGAYHVILGDGRTFDVPAHWWNARWVAYPKPIAIVLTPDQLISARRMFPYGDTGCKVDKHPITPKCTLMDSSSITIYMPQTGERADIGLITDNSAYYMLGQDPDGMIQWGLGGSTCPAHFRDQNTGKPIDLIQYFSTNAYSLPGYQGSPWVAQGQQQANGYCDYGGGWQPQQAHYCEMSYMAYQTTRNLSFLEDLQYSANFTVFADAYVSGGQKKPTIFGELRGIAWAFRNLFMAHAATQDAEADGALPDGCLPSSYWKNLLDIQLAYYTKYMADPANQYYRLVSGGDRFGPWQVDYMLTALAFGILTGHSDWVPLYLWALKNAVDRTSNQSGYPPGWGGAYYLNTCEWGKNPDGTWNQGVFNHSKPLDWYGTFLFQVNDPNGAQPTPAQIASLKIDPLHGGIAIEGNEYLMTTRAVLVQADYLEKIGLVDVRAQYPFDASLKNISAMFLAYGSVNPRQSVVSIHSTTLPPQGGLMPTSFSIAVGATEQLNLVLNGALTDGPIYTTDAPTIVSLEPNAAGVIVTGLAAGSAKIIATGTGATELSAESDATVTLPLATTMELVPA